jgi:signal transduction histidine kinase
MKLSIQHLLRKIEMQDADAPQLVQTALPGLIEQIDALARMANEFARFAKLPEPVFEAIELHAFVEQVLLLFDEDQNRIQLYSQKEPLWILADKDMLSQVLNNLLLNAKQAIDARPNPAIEIKITSAASSVTIAIHDNGIGIPIQEQDKIFTPYFTTKSSGSGIGLSVVRQIIEKHNGQIWFESEEGVGTVFYVKLNRNN